LSPKDAPLVIDVRKRKPGSLNLALRNGCVNTGERIDETNFYGSLTACLDDERRGNLCSTQRCSTAKHSAAVNAPQEGFRHQTFSQVASALEFWWLVAGGRSRSDKSILMHKGREDKISP
jgi:hypothetical protein